MGCASSSINKEERVQICKERIKLMQQLMVSRGEFAGAQMAYLKALRNTGSTLRQFTESESLELEDAASEVVLPPPPPPPLPPSPPPLPFSPVSRDSCDSGKDSADEENIELGGRNRCSPLLLHPSTLWKSYGLLEPSSPLQHQDGEITETGKDGCADKKNEHEEVKDDRDKEVLSMFVKNPVLEKTRPVVLTDEDSFMTSWYANGIADADIESTTLESIISELDEYFLKASDGGKDIAVLMDFKKGDISSKSFNESSRKKNGSAKVFSALSRSWSSKSIQITRDALEDCDSSEPCMPGAHCITLRKLYAAEQELHKEIKEEESVKLKYERKLFLLQKQEEENIDWANAENTRSVIESLGNDLSNLQQSISRISSSILGLIDFELHPQLVALTSGLLHMWRMVYECHKAQNHISQQLNRISDCQSLDIVSDYRHQATIQLETEVTLWYNSFCKLIESQKEYVGALCRWIQLTECLVNDQSQSACSHAVHSLCNEWQYSLQRLPDKVTSEAIKKLLSAIRPMIQHQTEEQNLQKKIDKLEEMLQKALHSLADMEYKLGGNFIAGDTNTSLSSKNPLSVKQAKIETLKKQVDDEKAKYLNSVEVGRRMTLNYLKNILPNLFQTLMEFSSACTLAFESVTNHLQAVDSLGEGRQIAVDSRGEGTQYSTSTCSDNNKSGVSNESCLVQG